MLVLVIAEMCCQADMVLSSIGYKSKPMEGVAFDAAKGVVIHRCAPQAHMYEQSLSPVLVLNTPSVMVEELTCLLGL